MTSADDLSREYEALHVAKEDAFWAAYMGLTGNVEAAREDLDNKEKALAAWLQDPERLVATRAALAQAEASDAPESERVALEGWVRTFEAHVIDSAQGRRLASELIDLEGALANRRASMKLGYTDPRSGAFVPASSVKLGTTLRANPDPALRKAAYQGLASIEPFVLENGYLDVVRKRNQLGRLLGAEDYYDWKVRRVEQMSKRDIFELLDTLVEQTQERHDQALDELKTELGVEAAEPWNLQFAISGDVTKEQDPYFPFSRSLERWGKSFAALGIDYAGSTLVVDLVDRPGKYENGFCHMPEPAWRQAGAWRPARVHFTANAIVGMVGSGKRATTTLFHEGGHAAHFSNIDMPAPCFSQEFAPTSAAFAEVQSMFLDSLLEDADWQVRYAHTEAGKPMPTALIEKGLRANQRGAATRVRAMCAICYAERAIYEIPDDELTAERVLQEVRAVEQRLLGGPSWRPVLSVPHLLAGESSAYYHSYVLALMGVHQTREFFLARDGHLLDNPRIGPELKRIYWQPGNSKRLPDFIETLTGQRFSAEPLARAVSRSPDEAVSQGRAMLDHATTIDAFEGDVALNATIAVVHGTQQIASTADGSFQDMCDTFATWIDTQQAR